MKIGNYEAHKLKIGQMYLVTINDCHCFGSFKAKLIKNDRDYVTKYDGCSDNRIEFDNGVVFENRWGDVTLEELQ